MYYIKIIENKQIHFLEFIIFNKMENGNTIIRICDDVRYALPIIFIDTARTLKKACQRVYSDCVVEIVDAKHWKL